MRTENLYIPQSYEIEEVETIEYIAYPELLELSFDDIIVMETESLEWD